MTRNGHDTGISARHAWRCSFPPTLRPHGDRMEGNAHLWSLTRSYARALCRCEGVRQRLMELLRTLDDRERRMVDEVLQVRRAAAAGGKCPAVVTAMTDLLWSRR